MRDGERGNRVRASAPGKVVLSGEYAVLDGAPAILMAVDRRARVAIEASARDCHTVNSVGIPRVQGRFVVRGGDFDWRAGREDFRLVESVWRAANADVPGYLSLKLDTREFRDAGRGVKIGIGSSAALAAALSLALGAAAGADIDTARVAFAAHREFQGGLGSGADIACCVLGGLVDFSMGGDYARLAWPEGLEIGLLWSGVPADTGSRLERLAGRETHPSKAALVLAAHRFAEAWRAGIARDVLQECTDYTRVLREFSVDHELGIFDAGHGELVDAARRAGLVCKPCGAGGGDVAMVLATDRARLVAFLERSTTSGFTPLPAGLDHRGVEIG